MTKLLNPHQAESIDACLERLPVGKFDYAVVPGAGADTNSSPSAWGCDMLDVAARLYEKGLTANIITTGGLSPGDPGPATYADAGKNYLVQIQRKIAPDKVITINEARDTIGDIFFLAEKVKSMVNAAPKQAPAKFLVIAPDYQAKRIRVITEHLFGLLSDETHGRNYSVAILPINNPYLNKTTLQDRQGKEAGRIKVYRDTWAKYRSLAEFKKDLINSHGAYNGEADAAMQNRILSTDLKPEAHLFVRDPRTRVVLQETPTPKLGDGTAPHARRVVFENPPRHGSLTV